MINIRPGFTPDANDENTQLFHQKYQTADGFGILTTKPLPRLSEMKFYLTYGLVYCSISDEAIPIVLNDARSIERLQKFHAILFRDVLTIRKEFFVRDDKDSYMIVPTRGKEIFWSFVENFQKWKEPAPKTQLELQAAVYSREDWLHKVIWPTYRADPSIRYGVTRVFEHKTPQSEFPNTSHESYASYVLDKYGREVVNKEQFLVEVKGITTHLNRLTPGQGEDGKKKTTARDPELLIPELCHNFEFPLDLWLKAVVLPSCLHRLQYLMHAEQLRVKINAAVGVVVNNYRPRQITERAVNKRDEYDSGPSTSNSIVIPNPNTVPQKVVKAGDFGNIGQALELPWDEKHEPLDLDREFDRAFSIEIDYYYRFVHDMSTLSLDDEKARKVGRTNRFVPQLKAICEAPTFEKLPIRLLRIKLTTPVNGVEQDDLLAAITAASSADVFDMERLEVIGDAFLKFATSLYLIQRHTDWHEGHLTTIKSRIISNRNLCYSAIKLNLPGMIKLINFNPRDDWQPPMTKVPDFVQVIFNLKVFPHNLPKIK